MVNLEHVDQKDQNTKNEMHISVCMKFFHYINKY